MGEAARRRKALETNSLEVCESDSGPWWHGTDSNFTAWQIPPPRKAGSTALDLAHQSLFFTKEADFARKAGSRLCEVRLTSHARVLTPGQGTTASRKLRQALREHNVARHCAWLRDDEQWIASWKNGKALRFASDDRTVRALLIPVIRNFGQLYPDLPKNALEWVAMQNLTRDWIELIAQHAKHLGYDAVQGRELDSETGPDVSRSWMAVMDANVITAPSWVG